MKKRQDGLQRWGKLKEALDDAFEPYETSSGAPPIRTDAHLIERGLYLGSLLAARNARWLTHVGVTHVLSVMHDWRRPNQTDVNDQMVERLFIPVDDTANTDISQYMKSSYEWINAAHQSGGIVLVHCHMGISRSTTIVCSYLMQKYGLSVKTATKRIRSKRRCVKPNKGFIDQLENLYLQMKNPTHPRRKEIKSFLSITPLTIDLTEFVLSFL